MKHFLLFVMLFVAGNLFATDYYVSDSGGNDSNDGLTEGTAWKTLSKITGTTFSLGDVIHLKRGDVWYGQNLTISSSGEAGNPITYTSYGTGDLPEIRAMATFDNSEISWTDKGSNIWEATINSTVIGSPWNQYFYLERLYINDSEVLGTPTVGNVGTTVPDRVVFNYKKSTQLLTLYSVVDPSTLKIECSYAQYAVSISHIEYVDIENIKITGGNIYGISLRASKNINLTNIDIGEAAYTAVYIGDISDNISEDIIFDNCTFDSNYDFDFSTSSSYKRGPQIGISGRFSDNIEIKNSTFKNFTNASLRLEDYSAGENCTNWKVHNNLFTASLAHGGRISVCTGAESLEFYNNTIDGVSGYMHLRGNNNHYHHNIIKNVRNSPIISRKTGFGICTFDDGWDGSTTNNIYENNIIMDCENAGIYLRGSSSYNTDGNIFRNNILINNGVGSLKLGLWIEDYSGSGDRVKNNTFDNNLFYQEGWTSRLVSIYGHNKTMAQFNAFTDYGTSASGNLRADPLFVDMAGGDYHLQSGSPAIDGGTTPLATLDYEGNPIPYISTLPDIGIYETNAGLVLAVSPSSRSVGAASGTTTFAVASNVNWSVSESSNWLTATKTDATTLYVAFVENISLDDRSANITVSGPGVTSQTVTVEQDGATPVLTVSPSSQTVSSLNGTVTFTVVSNVDWSVSDSSSWLTATKTDATTLTVTYDENTSIVARSASITLSGPGVTSQTVTVNQNDATPQLTVSPASRPVGSASGTVTFSVISNVDWSVSESSGWLTATKTNATTLTVTYDENTGLDDRSASITLSGPDVTSQTVTVNQDGIIPVLTVSPSSQTVSTQAGTVTFTVTSNIDWSVSESSGWLTATKINATTLTVSYNENGSVDARSASITLSGTGVASKTVTVEQDGATPVLYASPSSKTVSTQAGTTTFTVTSNVDWSVSESSNWLKATKINATTLYVSFDENTSLDDRSASITLSRNGVTPYTVTVNQDGVTPVLTVSPSSQTVSSSNGTVTFAVASNIDWSVSESSDWLTATKTDATTLTVTYDENTDLDDRSASITLSGPDVTSQTVTVNQEGATPVLTVSPSSQSVGSESGTTTFTVTSNVDWSVSESSDWLTATKTDATTLTVSYDENKSVDTRSASITLSGTGVTSQTVTVEQKGATPVLTVSPSSQSVGSESGTTTFTVTSNVDWSVSESSDWLTATKTDATTLTVSYDENANEDARSAEISISGTGVSSISVTFSQEGRTNVDAIINEFDNSTITVYPNPASDKLFIKSNNSIRQDILIKLFDGAGNLIYSNKKEGLSANDIVDIDISSFTSGQYILQMDNGETIKIRKVIKR